MEVRAVSKYLRVSAQKTRLVADMVRGKKVDEALITAPVYAEKERAAHNEGAPLGHGKRRKY